MSLTEIFPNKYKPVLAMPKHKTVLARLGLTAFLTAQSLLMPSAINYAAAGQSVTAAVSTQPAKPTSRNNTSQAPKLEYIIDALDVTTYNPDGSVFMQYTKDCEKNPTDVCKGRVKEKGSIKVREGGSWTINSPTHAYEKNKRAPPLKLDQTLQLNGTFIPNYAYVFGSNVSPRSYGLSVDIDDLKIPINKDETLRGVVMAEEGPRTIDVKASVEYFVNVLNTPDAPKENTQRRINQPTTPTTPPTQTATPQNGGSGSTQTNTSGEIKSKVEVEADVGTAVDEYVITVDPIARKNMFIGKINYHTSKLNLYGGVRFRKDAGTNPNEGRLSSIESSINANYRFADFDGFGIVASGEAGRSNHKITGSDPRRTTFNIYDYPESKTTNFSAGGGIVIGKNTGSHIEALVEKAFQIQESGFNTTNYGDITLDTRKLNGNVMKINGIIDGKRVSFQASYSNSKLSNNIKTVETESNSFTGRVLFAVDSEGKFRIVLGGNTAKYTENGIDTRTKYYNTSGVFAGVSIKNITFQ